MVIYRVVARPWAHYPCTARNSSDVGPWPLDPFAVRLTTPRNQIQRI